MDIDSEKFELITNRTDIRIKMASDSDTTDKLNNNNNNNTLNNKLNGNLLTTGDVVDEKLPLTTPSQNVSTDMDGKTEVDGKRSVYSSTKSAAEGMMDIALLTANANQLRFMMTYNRESQTYLISIILIGCSLLLQVAVGFAIIFKRQMKNSGRRDRAKKTNDFLVAAVFLITIINIFVASFTTTDTALKKEN